MHELNVKFGMWTNGMLIVMAINTTDETVPEDQRIHELTFSTIRDICGTNEIYQGLAGFCLASIEYSLLATVDAKMDFINSLCPEDWRVVPPPFQLMPILPEEVEGEQEQALDENNLEFDGDPENSDNDNNNEEGGEEGEEEEEEEEDGDDDDDDDDNDDDDGDDDGDNENTSENENKNNDEDEEEEEEED